VLDSLYLSPTFAQFDLVDKKELAPLEELNDAILAEDGGKNAGGR
jgi:hypothetical protein